MKRIIAALTSMALVIGLAGCSASGTGPGSANPETRATRRSRNSSASPTAIATPATTRQARPKSRLMARVPPSRRGRHGRWINRHHISRRDLCRLRHANRRSNRGEPARGYDKAQIVLDGVTIHNEGGPAIQVDQADKVFLTLADGSTNVLSDGASYALAEGEDEPYAALYSKDDLTINGSGALEVTGNYRHAIASKDDTVITGRAPSASRAPRMPCAATTPSKSAEAR